MSRIFGNHCWIVNFEADVIFIYLVSDRHRRVENQLLRPGLRSEVDDMTGQDTGVRDGDALVLRGPEPRRQQVAMNDVTHRLADLNPVPDLVGTHVDEDDTRDDVAHRPARSDRDQHADEERHALERRRVRPRDVRERDDEGER